MRFLSVAVISLYLLGCSGGADDAPQTVPVTGTVKLNGDPLADARVNFIPADAGQLASGLTDSQGNFSLKTNGIDGAPTGSYKVSVASNAPEPMPGVEDDAGGSPLNIPEKFSNAEESGLTAEVSQDGDNTFTFDLKE